MEPNQMFQEAAQAAQDAMNSFGCQQPYDAEQFYAQAAAEAAQNAQYQQQYQQQYYQNQNMYQQTAQQTPPPSQEEEKKAKGFLNNFIDYLKNGGFKKDIDCTSKQYNVPPKKLAQNFLETVLGTIGDILGIAISTIGNAFHTLIDVLSTLAHGVGNVVVNVANGIASFVTLNKTCVAQ